MQQTSEFINQLQKEKVHLTNQLTHYKTILEAGGLKQFIEPGFLTSQDFNDSTTVNVLYDDVPLKKRRKFEASKFAEETL